MFFQNSQSVKASDSVEEFESDSMSKLLHDFVGDGGRGTLVGVRLNQFTASESFVGEDGGVKLQNAAGSSNCGILSYA
jgi:hypothetical protein